MLRQNRRLLSVVLAYCKNLCLLFVYQTIADSLATNSEYWQPSTRTTTNFLFLVVNIEIYTIPTVISYLYFINIFFNLIFIHLYKYFCICFFLFECFDNKFVQTKIWNQENCNDQFGVGKHTDTHFYTTGNERYHSDHIQNILSLRINNLLQQGHFKMFDK